MYERTKERRGALVLRRLALLILVIVAIAVPVAASEAEVIQETRLCAVNTEPAPTPDDWILAPCEATNIQQANGGYTLVLHGQHPDYPYDHAIKFDQGCLVNFLFMARVGFPGDQFIFVDSVTHFDADGYMTQTCHYRP